MAPLTIQQAFDLALQHHRAGQFREAEQLYRQVLAQQPQHVDAMHYLGLLARQAGRNDIAMELISAAIALRPNNAEAHCNLGNLLASKGERNQAIACYQKAIAINPNFSAAQSNLGNALREEGRLNESVEAHRRAVALTPSLPEAHGNLANALRDKGELVEAIAAYRRAISLKGDYVEAHSNLGTALADTGEFDQAIAAFRRAIALKPGYADAHWNLSLALLKCGQLLLGWEEYEWRWQSRGFLSPTRNFSQPQWDGSPLNGRTILVHAEQGFGDTLQFIRYVPLIAERGGDVVVECPPELRDLLQPLVGRRPIVVDNASLPAFDVHCPMMSLPRAFGTTLDSVPRSIPYLRADAGKVAAWRRRLSGTSMIKVGLTWAGRPTHKNDANRSMTLQTLAPLAGVGGAAFYSLQKGKAAAQAFDPPPGMKLIDLMGDVTDFSDAAAFIENLDLVITVDTAIAHLAGAMGKAVWTLLPYLAEWRWLRDRQDSPWYPTMRLFRQGDRGQWADVVARVVDALTLLIHRRSP